MMSHFINLNDTVNRDESIKTYFKFKPLGHCDSKIWERTMDIIQNNRIYMASYKDMNDPMEAFYKTSSIPNNIKQAIYDEKMKTVMACLSKENSDVLLWSHYADGHRGCCIEV